MRLNEIVFTDAKPVEGYGPGFFRIGGQVIKALLLQDPRARKHGMGLQTLTP